MDQRYFEEFGEAIVSALRDKAIRACDECLKPDNRSSLALYWRRRGGANIPASEIVPDVVDMTIATLLSAIEQGQIPLKYETRDGTMVDPCEIEDGGLSGYFLVQWIEKYAKERHVNWFAETEAEIDAIAREGDE